MHCAIDFGTSNSAVAVPDGAGGMRLVDLEDGHTTMPTAVFYADDAASVGESAQLYGRAAVAAYVDGIAGRLLRSMKSILGSDLAERVMDVGGGRGVPYLDVIAGTLRHLKARAEAAVGAPIRSVVLGRPVFFVDDDPARDAAAQQALCAAARAAGFDDIDFAYEPIAAALDHERGVTREELVLVADIGGGTSDFALVRIGPGRAPAADRRGDILASHGVHVAGTDFDRRIALAGILPEFGYRGLRPALPGESPREVPSAIYFDLATWHLVNTLYTPQRMADLRQMRAFHAEPRYHARLLAVLVARRGHDLLARAEAAKIATAEGADTCIDLGDVEPGLAVALAARHAAEALGADVARIVAAARHTVALAGVDPGTVDALYFTGGSTGLRLLTEQLGAAFPHAEPVHGDRGASVARGLGLVAQRRAARRSAPGPAPA